MTQSLFLLRNCFVPLHMPNVARFFVLSLNFSQFLPEFRLINIEIDSQTIHYSSQMMILKAPIARHYESLDGDNSKKLTLFFATLCVIDLFGVFPIVTLPRSLISCGYYGVPLILLVFSLQTYTAVVLGRCWIIAEKLDPLIVNKNRFAYAAIGEMAFGAPMKLFVTFLLDLTVFGAGIPNLLVASQNLQLLGLRMSSGSFNFSFCYFLIIIGLFLCPIMWLGSPKNMR